MDSSTTSTLISGERPANQLLDSFISTTEDDNQMITNQNILPLAKLSIEATLCEQAEMNKPAAKIELNYRTRGDSSEISDEELVEYPIELLKQEILIKPATSPASQTDSNLHLTSSASAQTIPTSASGEYLTAKSGITSSNVTSAASYLTAHDSTFHSKTLSISNSDSTLSSDSGTLIDDQPQAYEELLDVTPTKKVEQPPLYDRISDLKDEEDDDDSSSTGDLLYRTIISNLIKEPYDTEIPKSVICSNSLNESTFIKSHTIEQQQQEFQNLQMIEPTHQQQQQSLVQQQSKVTPRVSFSEQSDSSLNASTSIETAIYRGGGDQSDFSSLESNTDLKNEPSLRNEQMPSIMASGNLDQWDDSNLDDEMIIHEDIGTTSSGGGIDKKNSIDLYTLEEEEESKTEDLGLSNKLIKDLKQQQQQHSSADNSSSLMEFERLEQEVDQGNGSELNKDKLIAHHNSLDSIGSFGSTGVLGTPKLLGNNAPQSDNTSNNSLNEFERLEQEFLEQQQEQQEQIKKQLTEIEEGHESQASDSADQTGENTISGCSQIRMPKEEDDSEIELELNAKLDDFTSSCPTAQQLVEDLDATPVHIPHETDDEYNEEFLKIVTTTKNRIIEEQDTTTGKC